MSDIVAPTSTVAGPLDVAGTLALVQEALPDAKPVSAGPTDYLEVAPDQLLEALRVLRDQGGCDLLSSITCTDYLSYQGRARGQGRSPVRGCLPPVQHRPGRGLHCPARAGGRRRAPAHGDAGVSRRQPAGTGGLGPVRPGLRRPPQSAPHPALGRFRRPPPCARTGTRPTTRRTRSPSAAAIRGPTSPAARTRFPGARTPATRPTGIRTTGRSPSPMCRSARIRGTATAPGTI